MMNMVMSAFLKFVAPLVVLVALLALTVISLVYAIQNTNFVLYIVASLLIGFSAVPAMMLYEGLRHNKRVLLRNENLEVRCHPAYKKCPNGLEEFVDTYPFMGVMDSIEAEISAQPDLVINKGFNYVNLVIEFCPSEVLQSPHQNGTKKIGGLQYGNTVTVIWKPEDILSTKNCVTHELGHVLIWLNHPTLDVTKHHEILAKCHL